MRHSRGRFGEQLWLTRARIALRWPMWGERWDGRVDSFRSSQWQLRLCREKVVKVAEAEAEAKKPTASSPTCGKPTSARASLQGDERGRPVRGPAWGRSTASEGAAWTPSPTECAAAPPVQSAVGHSRRTFPRTASAVGFVIATGPHHILVAADVNPGGDGGVEGAAAGAEDVDITQRNQSQRVGALHLKKSIMCLVP
jgi:hypothetical protein